MKLSKITTLLGLLIIFSACSKEDEQPIENSPKYTSPKNLVELNDGVYRSQDQVDVLFGFVKLNDQVLLRSNPDFPAGNDLFGNWIYPFGLCSDSVVVDIVLTRNIYFYTPIDDNTVQVHNRTEITPDLGGDLIIIETDLGIFERIADVPVDWFPLESQNFSNGFGDWDGTNAEITDVSSLSPAAGLACELNGPESTLETPSIDYRKAAEIEIRFSFYSLNTEVGDFIRLEIQEDAGEEWVSIQSAEFGADVQSSSVNSVTRVLNTADFNLGESTKFRIRNDVDGPNELLYLDNLRLRSR